MAKDPLASALARILRPVSAPRICGRDRGRLNFAVMQTGTAPSAM